MGFLWPNFLPKDWTSPQPLTCAMNIERTRNDAWLLMVPALSIWLTFGKHRKRIQCTHIRRITNGTTRYGTLVEIGWQWRNFAVTSLSDSRQVYFLFTHWNVSLLHREQNCNSVWFSQVDNPPEWTVWTYGRVHTALGSSLTPTNQYRSALRVVAFVAASHRMTSTTMTLHCFRVTARCKNGMRNIIIWPPVCCDNSLALYGVGIGRQRLLLYNLQGHKHVHHLYSVVDLFVCNY
jgi:hypothetical protein